MDCTWLNNTSRAQQKLVQSDFYSFDQKKVSCLIRELLPIGKKSYAYLTDPQYYTWLLKKYFRLHLWQSEYQQAIVKRLNSSFG